MSCVNEFVLQCLINEVLQCYNIEILKSFSSSSLYYLTIQFIAKISF